MITKTKLKTFLGITLDNYDDKIDFIVDGANAFVESYCRNKLKSGNVVEYFNGEDIADDNNLIFLSNRINISDIVIYYNEGTEAVPSWVIEDRVNYILQLEEGIVKLIFNRDQSGCNDYKITYTAGYNIEGVDEDVPADLVLAVLKLAGAFYNKSNSEGHASEGLDGANVSFSGSLNAEIKAILSNYFTKVI